MISRITLQCKTCSGAITARVQVGHEEDQLVSSVCPHCFTPFRIRLLLEQPPRVRVDCVENCEHFAGEGVVLNIGSGFVLSKSKSRLDKYFPSFDAPRPTREELLALAAADEAEEGEDEGGGPRFIDITVAMGGLPRAKQVWRVAYNAYRLSRTGNAERATDLLRQHSGLDGVSVKRALLAFIQRFLAPNGTSDLKRLTDELSRSTNISQHEFNRLYKDFHPQWEDRMDQKLEVIDGFFRAYDEFNQALVYARRGIDLPEDPYAPSTDFEHTRMYYGEAFEVLGSHVDILVAFNNILSSRAYDQLELVPLAKYRTCDKGIRNRTLLNNPELAWMVAEYENKLRNASHHRWLRLSTDRSELSFREGGSGQLVRLSYAEYLLRCCQITRQLMLLAAVEWLVLADD